MNKINDIFLELPEVKRIRELEKYLNNNLALAQKKEDLKLAQKKMVNAREYNQHKQYILYKEEYDKIYSEILDFPFVEEYLELLEEINHILLQFTGAIEDKINGFLK